jgi:hypothetical protein
MQLCYTCLDNYTDPACQLEKRTKGDHLAACEQYQADPDRQAIPKADVKRLLRKVARPATETIVQTIGVPLELSVREYPPDLCLEFLNLDLVDEEAISRYLIEHVVPRMDAEEFAAIPTRVLADEFHAAQQGLRGFMEGRPGGLQDVNRFLRCAQVQLEVRDHWLTTITEYQPSPFGNVNSIIIPPVLQTVNYLLHELPVIKCPVCGDFYQFKRSGPPGKTCGKSKCRTALSRDPSKYLRKTRGGLAKIALVFAGALQKAIQQTGNVGL